jgi:DNA primase large subunit
MYSRYPFLYGARSLFDKSSTSIKYTAQTFSFFNRLLLGPVYEQNNQLPQIEVTIFYNIMVILKKLNSKYISRMFLGNYAKRFEYFFLMDMQNKDVRDEVLDFFGISTEYQRYKEDIVQMSVPYYLALTRDGADFRLVNQAVKRGTVTITNNRFALILRTILEKALMKRIEDMKPVDSITFGTEYDEMILKIGKQYGKNHQMYSTTTVGTGQLPPCMSCMIEKAKTEHHLTHIERLTLAIYLKSKNYDEDYILDIYKQLSDYNEKITKYQVDRAGNYKVYNCDKLQTEGLCKKDLDKNNRCEKISNPFLY